jgi:glyoxylase-like metal-dependent hydrolase (beta-lactamase superfamily II)
MGPAGYERFGGRPGALLQELEALSLSPEDIDIVFLTHLHFDHVGWNLTSAGTPTFSRARYVLHQAEWDARVAHDAHVLRPFTDRLVTPLRTLGVLDLVAAEHALTPEVIAFPTPGHSPGHMSVLVNLRGEKALIIADVLVHPGQVTEPDWSSGLIWTRSLHR